jgi:hypothetical protein
LGGIYPEPHGAAINNLGVYRDAGFTDQACAFIRRKALALNYNRAQAVEQAQDPYATGPDARRHPALVRGRLLHQPP